MNALTLRKDWSAATATAADKKRRITLEGRIEEELLFPGMETRQVLICIVSFAITHHGLRLALKIESLELIEKESSAWIEIEC